LSIDSIDKLFEEGDDIGYFQATKDMFRYGVPSIFGMLLRRTVDIINYLIIGRMGNPSFISGAGLGITTINITTMSLGVGLAGGVETLSSQAFGRNKNYLAGTYYTRAQVILTFLFIPQAILLYFATPILKAVGQPEVSSEYAGEYIKVLIVGAWGF